MKAGIDHFAFALNMKLDQKLTNDHFKALDTHGFDSERLTAPLVDQYKLCKKTLASLKYKITGDSDNHAILKSPCKLICLYFSHMPL